MRKLGGIAEAAVDRVEHPQYRFHNGINHTRRKLATTAGKGFRLRECALYHFCLLYYLTIFFVVGVGNGQQHSFEAGSSMLIARRKVGTAVKRLAIRRKESSKRPSTLPADCAHRGLITAIDVGAFIAIHLHRN